MGKMWFGKSYLTALSMIQTVMVILKYKGLVLIYLMDIMGMREKYSIKITYLLMFIEIWPGYW